MYRTERRSHEQVFIGEREGPAEATLSFPVVKGRGGGRGGRKASGAVLATNGGRRGGGRFDDGADGGAAGRGGAPLSHQLPGLQRARRDQHESDE